MLIMRMPSDKIHSTIITKAEQLFLKKGYIATTLDMIARESNVTKRTVYAHFKDKNTILLAVVEKAVGKSWEPITLSGEFKTEDDLRFALFTVAQGINAVLTQKKYVQMLRVAISEVDVHPDLELFYEHGVVHMSHQKLTDVLTKAMNLGIITINNPQMSSRMFIGGFVVSMYLDGLLRPAGSSLHKLTTIELFMYVDEFLTRSVSSRKNNVTTRKIA